MMLSMQKILPLLIASGLLCAQEQDNSALQPLFNSLDPLSVSEHLAFYELYPEAPEGKEALSKAWKLLSCTSSVSSIPNATYLPKVDVRALISLVTRQSHEPPPKLNDEQLGLIDTLSAHLGNRRLKGYQIWSKEEVLSLTPEEIDLSRGLLLNQFADRLEIRQYEASIDLMALQILARLAKNPTHEEKIRIINRFIFQEMQFRFPPHSLYAKDIDLYTFLPSVLDSRQGVCLGVSILYLCLAQRLNLPLEIITPPGHIYVRYRGKNGIINIETTARGINTSSDAYLGIDTRKLEERTMKEVIGLAFFNQASTAWARDDYKTTVDLYEKALPFLKTDPLLKMLLGFNYLFVGKKTEGKKLLQEVKGMTFDYAVSPESMPDDYLSGKVDLDGLKAIFAHVDETRASILDKQKKLQEILIKYPHFRAGLFQLAITYLQLGRGSEALQILQRIDRFDPGNAVVNYYLCILCMQRYDYNTAWRYFKQAQKLSSERDHHPKALKSLQQELRRLCPDPDV
jgi:tetratricopeptide (TPR) repeat protein